MRLAGIAGLLAMLLLPLSAKASPRVTPLEHEVRTYLQSNGRFHQLLGVSDEAAIGRVICGRAGHPADLMCALPVTDKGLAEYQIFHRYFVSRAPHGAFYFEECPRYVHFSFGEIYSAGRHACWADIARG